MWHSEGYHKIVGKLKVRFHDLKENKYKNQAILDDF